jgi:RNase H-fold protein (predicted Holliday junction resolvase)
MPIVLAIDPGRAKCGIAVVESAGGVLHRAVVAVPALPALLVELAARFPLQAILLGNGTGAEPLHAVLTGLGLPAPLVRVDERHTSEQARARYLAENTPRGWRRLVPRSLRVPESPYDDYVAVILAERWWEQQKA